MACSGKTDYEFSDKRMKELFGDYPVVDCFAKIHSYVFKYKPEVQAEFAGEKGIDGDTHFGVMAQELEKNPYTASAVSTDPVTGYKQVDTRELTMANTAAIAEIMRQLEAIKSKIGE